MLSVQWYVKNLFVPNSLLFWKIGGGKKKKRGNYDFVAGGPGKPGTSLCDLGNLENQGKLFENLENIFIDNEFSF